MPSQINECFGSKVQMSCKINGHRVLLRPFESTISQFAWWETERVVRKFKTIITFIPLNLNLFGYFNHIYGYIECRKGPT